MLTYISLFSGIGGFDLAFDRAGMACLAQVEINENARDVLAHHWPNVKRFKDVKDVGKHNLTTPDVLCGGFPCQDVSVAGNRTGLAGQRSGLWYEFHRIITELSPRFVVIENVPGLLSSNKGRDFAVILGGLTGIIPDVPAGGWKNAGIARGYAHLYRVAWRVLDAQHFGVAQRRRRVFVVASLGTGSCAQILFEQGGSSGDSQTRRAEGQDAPAFAGVSFEKRHSGGDGDHAEGQQAAGVASTGGAAAAALQPVTGTVEAVGTDVAQTSEAPQEVGFLMPFRMLGFGHYTEDQTASAVKARDYKDATDLVAFNLTFNDVNGRRKDRPNGGMYVRETAISHTLNAGVPSEKTLIAQKPDRIKEWVETDDRIRAVQSDAKASTAQEHVYYKPNAVVNALDTAHTVKALVAYGIRTDVTPKVMENKTPTLVVPSSSGGGHPMEVLTPDLIARRLTPTECERLQGFPDGWTVVKKRVDSHTYMQTGNSVAVPVLEWIGQRIVAAAWSELSGIVVQP